MAYTTIDDPSLYFRIKLYNGNNNAQNIAFDETHENMQPDILWIKSRAGSTVFNHVLGNSGSGSGKYLHPNTTAAEVSNANVINTFNTNGFSVGGATFVSEGGRTYVAWAWKESTVAGLDIVNYSGNGSNRTISHNLSAVPAWILFKSRTSSSQGWAVFHQSIANTKFVRLNELDGANTSTDGTGNFNSTSPTSSVFTVGTALATNESGKDIQAFVWREVKGFSKMSSYTGNGSASDGVFVYTGFRVSWLMIKRTDSSNSWIIMDTKRTTSNPMGEELKAEDSSAGNVATRWDQLSNGFKLRNTGGAVNASGGTYIYMAFAESPFVNSKGIPTNAR